MELMTSREFFGLVATLSPAEVLGLKLAVRSGSTKPGLPPYPAPQHTERDVLPDGAGTRGRDGVQGDPGTGDDVPHETGRRASGS